MTVGERPVVYAPRSIRSNGWSELVPGWRIKHYSVSALREVPEEGVRHFAEAAVLRSLPPAYPTALSCGYSVVHEDADGCYAVVGWWSPNRVILHTRTWLAGWEDLSDFVEAPSSARACIWELVPMAHERTAWVRHVVQPEQPDVAAYLADTVSGEF